jgi:hypothetical protein
MSKPELSEEIGAEIGTPHDQEAAVRELVAKALHSCRKRLTREQVAEQLTKAAGFRVTRGMVDDWSSPSKKGLRFPASLIKPFFEITECSGLAQAFMPYRLVFLAGLGEWVYQSRKTLERIHQDLLSLTRERDQKTRKPKLPRRA